MYWRTWRLQNSELLLFSHFHFLQVLRLALPHVTLLLVSLLYAAFGGWVLTIIKFNDQTTHDAELLGRFERSVSAIQWFLSSPRIRHLTERVISAQEPILRALWFQWTLQAVLCWRRSSISSSQISTTSTRAALSRGVAISRLDPFIVGLIAASMNYLEGIHPQSSSLKCHVEPVLRRHHAYIHRLENPSWVGHLFFYLILSA